MKLNRQQQGLATVEFAIVGTLLLTILFGICDMAILLCNQAIITNASWGATRSGVVYKVPPLTDTEIKAVATNYCSDLMNSKTGITPTVTVTHLTKDAIGLPLKVNVTYNYSYFVLNTLIGLPNPITLSATSTMYYE
ncbi:MAG: pilus assembly protein [Methylobacter sp.]|nr:pilus assembly protein [Methylobacter sp.]